MVGKLVVGTDYSGKVVVGTLVEVDRELHMVALVGILVVVGSMVD